MKRSAINRRILHEGTSAFRTRSLLAAALMFASAAGAAASDLEIKNTRLKPNGTSTFLVAVVAPLADYLTGLWSLGRKNDFLLSLYGHVAYHQAEGQLAAYEQVSFSPGKKRADYCLPCQLVAARAARLLVPAL